MDVLTRYAKYQPLLLPARGLLMVSSWLLVVSTLAWLVMRGLPLPIKQTLYPLAFNVILQDNMRVILFVTVLLVVLPCCWQTRRPLSGLLFVGIGVLYNPITFPAYVPIASAYWWLVDGATGFLCFLELRHYRS